MYKSILVIFTGSVFAQAISLISLPLLTRLYSAESYGIYSSVIAISSVLIVVSMGRYEQVIIQLHNEKEKLEVVVFSLLLLLVFSMFVLILENLFFYSYEKYQVVPMIILFYGLNILLEKKINSEGEFKILSKQKIIKSISEVCIALLFAHFFENDFGLIAGVLFGLGASSFFMFFTGKRIDIKDFDIENAKLTLLKYSNFPKYNMPHALLNSAVSYLPIISIPYFFDNKILGFYALSMKLLQTPFSLLSIAIYNVVSPKIARDYSTGGKSYKPLLYIISGQVIIALVVIFAMVILPGKAVFLFFFNNEWASAYDFMVIMLPWVLMTFIAMPFSCVTNIFHRQKRAFYIENITSITKTVALVIGGLYLSVEGMLIIFSIVSMVCVFLTLSWYVYILKDYYA